MTGADAASRTLIALSEREVDLLQMGLVRYMIFWQEHCEEDGGKTHSREDLERVTTEAGQLLWRLEQETAPPGVTIVPSEWAVAPLTGTGE